MNPVTKIAQKYQKCLCENCNRLVGEKGAKGLCSKHHKVLRKHGDPLFHDRKRQYEENVLNGNIKDDAVYYCLDKKPHQDGYIKDKDKRSIHRRIMEQKLGRPLIKKVEVVHHIDLNKLNNHPDNLYLCKDQSEHSKIHDQLEKLTIELMKLGIIRFDINTGTYILTLNQNTEQNS